MKVKVLYFGIYRDMIQKDSEIIEIDANADTDSMLQLLKKKYSALQKYPEIILSLNYKYCNKSCKLNENDEVAIMSPVNGG